MLALSLKGWGTQDVWPGGEERDSRWRDSTP